MEPDRRKVLITGGAGYIGSALSRHLVQAGWWVTVFDKMIYGQVPSPRPNLDVVEGDVRNASQLRAALRGHEGLIHLAFLSTDRAYDIPDSVANTVNIGGLRTAIDAAVNVGISRFIFPSSCSVYGRIEEDREVTESEPPNPLTSYAEQKIACETILESTQELLCIVPRFATVCGPAPRQRFDLAINRFVLQAVIERRISVTGPENVRPCVHIDDACRLYERLLNAAESSFTDLTFNVAFENRTLLEAARCVANAVGGVDIVCSPDSSGRSYRVNSQRLQRMFDFIPGKGVEDAARALAAALRSGELRGPFDTPRFNNLIRSTVSKALYGL